MNTHAGYSKKTLTDTNVLLAGGGDKSLADFLGGIQYVSASHKILIKTAAANASWVDLVTLITTDENVKLTPKTDDVNRPLMMINGGTSAGELTSTSMFSTGIYANASAKTIISNGFIKNGSDDTSVLLAGGGAKALSDFKIGDYLPLAGGIMIGIITGSNGGGSWGYTTTMKASLYKDTPTNSGSYFPIIGGAGGGGVWSYGYIGTSAYSYFSWDKSDGTHINIALRNVGGTIALLSDIPGTYPWDSITNKPDTATRWPTWDEVTNKPSTFPPSAHDHERILPTRHDSNAPSPKDKGASLTLQFSYRVIGTDWWNVLNMRSYVDYNYLSAQILTPAGNPGSDVGYGDMYWRLGRQSTWITARKILDDLNSSVSKSGETLTVKIGGSSLSLTNTWRGITDTYNPTTADSTISLSLTGAKALYNALYNGNADTVDYYHALTLTGSEGRNLIRNYDVAKSGSNYLVASYQPTEYLLKDEVYTCTFEILANDRTNPVPHLGNGHYCQFSSTITSGVRGIYSVTFTCNYTATNDSDARFDFYIRSANSGSTTIYRIKLERGPKFTGWSAAPEDLVLLYNAQTITGAKTFSNIITGDITGNAGTATKWLTARTLTIGNTGKSVDGSGNVYWSLEEIGLTWNNISSKPETATRWPKWSEVTEKPTTFTPSSHTHNVIYERADARNDSPTPLEANRFGRAVYFDFKSSDGPTGQGTYSAGFFINPWNGSANGTDWSGGPIHELRFNLNGKIYHRTGNASGWGTWTELIYARGGQTINGNLTATNFYTTSDCNKKTNISSFSEHIRKFQLKDTEKWYYGVIAQEVPKLFVDGEEGNMTVNYNSVLSYYIGQLENKVKELEDRLSKLEK